MERRRLAVLAALAVLAVPAAAQAAPVKIGPNPSSVASASATIEVANPNRYVLKGTATVTAGGARAASRAVKLRKRSVTGVRLRFGAAGIAALRAAGGRATVKLALKRAGGGKVAAKRTMMLRLAGAGGNGGTNPAPSGPGGGADPTPGTGATGGGTPKPASSTWTGRMGTEGAYDDFEFTLVDDQIQLTEAPFVPVYCFEMGGQHRNALSFEPFVVAGPWTLGQDAIVEQSGIAVNQLVSPGSRSISYKTMETGRSGDTITGKLGVSYFDSKYDIFANKIWFVNCSGAQSFEAVPAG